MSVVIVGGNDRMVRQYMDLCEQYKCRAKVFTQMKSGLKSKIGSPDLLVLFTGTMSHKMLRCALSETRGGGAVVVRSHSSSMEALRGILNEHTR
ncbi:MAG: DUF2325 domain-containing protein [Butyricicoccus sp.]|nr:DUF2325 domain-containing protein [Butyricicoccus sp.]